MKRAKANTTMRGKITGHDYGVSDGKYFLPDAFVRCRAAIDTDSAGLANFVSAVNVYLLKEQQEIAARSHQWWCDVIRDLGMEADKPEPSLSYSPYERCIYRVEAEPASVKQEKPQ